MSNITEFKTAYQRFIKALRYITENEAKLKLDPAKWERIKANFTNKFERVLDESWLALTTNERKSLSSVYLHRKAQTDPTVKKVVDTFNGRITSIEENENPTN